MYNKIWLVNSTLSFHLISLQKKFLIIKTVVSGKTSVIFSFFFLHNCNKSLWKNIFLVSLHSCNLPLVHATLQLTLSPSPTTCAIDYFQCFIFGNSQYTNKFTVNSKVVIHLTSSQESLKHKSTFAFTLHTIYPSTRSMAQTNIPPHNENTHIMPCINK